MIDPTAINLDKYRTGDSSHLALIAAVEALREKVLEIDSRYKLYKHIAKGVRGALEGEHTQRDILREFDIVVARAEDAETQVRELKKELAK